MMQQELNISYQNLKNQKKFLATSRFLNANKKPYQNAGMVKTISDTEILIKQIEEARFKVNNYNVMFNFMMLIENLEFMKFSREWDDAHDYIDHSSFIKMFGAEAAGPETIVTINAYGSTNRNSRTKVWYDDDCKEIRREPLLP